MRYTLAAAAFFATVMAIPGPPTYGDAAAAAPREQEAAAPPAYGAATTSAAARVDPVAPGYSVATTSAAVRADPVAPGYGTTEGTVTTQEADADARLPETSCSSLHSTSSVTVPDRVAPAPTHSTSTSTIPTPDARLPVTTSSCAAPVTVTVTVCTSSTPALRLPEVKSTVPAARPTSAYLSPEQPRLINSTSAPVPRVYPTATSSVVSPVQSRPVQFTGAASALNTAGYLAGAGAVFAYFL